MELKKEIQKHINDGLGWSNAEIEDIKEIKGGYLSNAYIVTIKKDNNSIKLFVKEQNGNNWGAERVTDPIATYISSDLANMEHGVSPKVLGSFVSIGNDSFPAQKIIGGKLFQIQEYVGGKNLFDLCYPRVAPEIQSKAKELGEKVAKLFVDLHSHKHPIDKDAKFDEYSRTLRDVISHPELTFNIFQNFLHDSKIFQGEFRYDYLKEMIKVAEHFSQFKERNSLIHGDAWHTNILLNKDEIYLIDYSRLVHGEPGIDIGHFYAVCICQAIKQHDDFHIEMANSFLDKYIELTGDEFIRESAVTYIGFTGAVSAVEVFYPDFDPVDRKNYVSYIYKCLQDKKLNKITTWKDIK